MMENKTFSEFSEENLITIRRRAIEHLSSMFKHWLGYLPLTNSMTAPPFIKTPWSLEKTRGFFDDFQSWLSPFGSKEFSMIVGSNIVREFMMGMESYLKCPFFRENNCKFEIVWKNGTTRLLDFKSGDTNLPAVLIIPSLINRYNIFDLMPGHSFLQFLLERGLRPFIVDWDEPGEEEKKFSISDYMTKRLMPIIDFVVEQTAQKQLHIIGYCMGGLLALALALLRREMALSLVLMATPWNFAMAGVSSPVLERKLAELADRVEPYLIDADFLPAEAMRIFFTSMQPLQIMEKFARFSTLDQSSIEAERFVLSEDWLNDGVPLAAPVARECLREWYKENKPGRIMWQVAGKLIDPRAIECPTYIIVPGKDKLVPPESARPLAKFIRGARLHEPLLGHIGLLASNDAPQKVWAPLTEWLIEKQQQN